MSSVPTAYGPGEDTQVLGMENALAIGDATAAAVGRAPTAKATMRRKMRIRGLTHPVIGIGPRTWRVYEWLRVN
jgi:hypothetical protein